MAKRKRKSKKPTRTIMLARLRKAGFGGLIDFAQGKKKK